MTALGAVTNDMTEVSYRYESDYSWMRDAVLQIVFVNTQDINSSDNYNCQQYNFAVHYSFKCKPVYDLMVLRQIF